MKHEPAYTIIKYLGGHKSVSSILNKDMSWIYRLTYPKEKGGRGGKIPSHHQQTLYDYACANGIDLRPEDFFRPERLQRLMAQNQQKTEKAG